MAGNTDQSQHPQQRPAPNGLAGGCIPMPATRVGDSSPDMVRTGRAGTSISGWRTNWALDTPPLRRNITAKLG
eukprot:10738463-Lingulodinium_polyedra.AAC.1